MHCAKPACVEICPEKAISKREEDGIVTVNQNKCVGCRSCSKACPFNIPQYGKSGKMQKCDMCLERLTHGKQPSCVATCPGEALKFGAVDDLVKISASGADGRVTASTAPAFFIAGRMTGAVFLGLLNDGN
jgi:Fe-S-cluster-containing dehydrogenase component